MQEITFIRDSTPDGKPNFINGVVRFYKQSDLNIFIGARGNGWITECQGIDKDTLNNTNLYNTDPWMNKSIIIKAKIITPIFVKITIPDDDCPICLNELSQNTCAKLSKCNHIFHNHCLSSWIIQSKSCPYCRTKIDNDNRLEIIEDTKGGGNKDIYINTGKKHICKDGISRTLYKKGKTLYIKCKCMQTGKMEYRKKT